MICSNDFSLAKNVLHRLSGQTAEAPFQGRFSAEYDGQNLVITALKIIHKVVAEGSDVQREELLAVRHEIIALNRLLSNNSLAEQAQKSLGIDLGGQAENLQELQLALPQTRFEKMIELATRIPRVILSILIDVALLPFAGILLLVMLAKPNFNPAHPKTDKTPILLLHGSGFNESEWILGRQFLKKEQCGSVFSLNYDGLASNDPAKGIDDYAAEKVRAKILEIKKLTGLSRIILIGHSMGGMIAGYYAEHFAAEDNIKVEYVMSVATPWQGVSLLDRFAGNDTAKRYKQMSVNNDLRRNLVATALQSERTGQRKYYSIGSTTDLMVPAPASNLTEDPRRQRTFSYLGHYGLIVSPRLWLQVRSWLDGIYAREPAVVQVRSEQQSGELATVS